MLILAIFVVVLPACIFVLSLISTPSGPHADFLTNGVTEIGLSIWGTELGKSRITETRMCLSVLETMRTARATRAHLCPAIGKITLQYADGTTNLVTLTPAHGFGRIELRDKTGTYSLSRAKLFRILKRAKRLPD
jgi:hypothetical protein